MKKLTFSIDINASQQKVWETMLNPATYKEWVAVSWPGSFYQGEWKEGTEIRFMGSEGGGGTLAKLDSVKPYNFISAEHIAVLLSGGVEDRDSEMAKGWIGSKENYTFSAKGKDTHLDVEIITNPAWESMFAEGWPPALKKLKEMCER